MCLLSVEPESKSANINWHLLNYTQPIGKPHSPNSVESWTLDSGLNSGYTVYDLGFLLKNKIDQLGNQVRNFGTIQLGLFV